MALFEQEEDYYKPKRVSDFWNNNYVVHESNAGRNRNLSLDEYLNKAKPYLWNKITDLQSSDIWKIQLTIAISFISSKDTEGVCAMHSKSDNIKPNDANEVFNELFECFRSRCQWNLKSDFVFDSVQLMYYLYHKVIFRCSCSYIDSPEITWNSDRYKWDGINYTSKIDDLKKFEKNNPTIALNIFSIKGKEILLDCISKHNSTCENQIILLMTSREEKEGWQKSSALLHEITSKYKGDFNCLNCLHSFRTENKLKSHQKNVKIKIFVELQCNQKRMKY